jgi:hypothetical protein
VEGRSLTKLTNCEARDLNPDLRWPGRMKQEHRRSSREPSKKC